MVENNQEIGLVSACVPRPLLVVPMASFISNFSLKTILLSRRFGGEFLAKIIENTTKNMNTIIKSTYSRYNRFAYVTVVSVGEFYVLF